MVSEHLQLSQVVAEERTNLPDARFLVNVYNNAGLAGTPMQRTYAALTG